MNQRVDYAPQAAHARHAQRRPLLSFGPPVLAWLGATAVVLGTCVANGWPPFAATATWAHEDANLYLWVARSGYNIIPCSQVSPPVPGIWCGNAGWFPAYPWIVGGLHLLGLPLAGTALAVSWLACLGTLIVLWRAFLVGRPGLAAGVALCYAALAPGLVYNYGTYPLSLTSFCAVVSLALLHRRRWLWAGIAAAVAALAYPVGLAVAPAGALWLLADRSVAVRERLRRAALVLGPWLVGLAAFVVDQRVSTGRWDAYLLVQQKYGHQLQDPLVAVGSAFRTFADSPFVARPSLASLSDFASATSLQTLLVFAVLVSVLAELAIRRGANLRNDALIAIWAVLAWLVVYTASQVHTYRGEVALLPVAVLVRRLPWPLSVLLTAVALVLVAPLIQLYHANVLR
jgi:hypothetical protein